MYRRLKNILGVSLMALAIVISQIPMPETLAGSMKEMTEEDMRVNDESAHVVTFSMNGGTYKGGYNDYTFQDKTPVLVIDHGKTISSFPDNKYASYPGYKTEADTWYTDQKCLTKYDVDSPVTESITLYKKWYNITSDGTELAAKGFHISADGTVLYRYDGEERLVEIPQTVTIIAEDAFDENARNVRGITLPAGIEKIEENAFRGVDDTNIVYIYDSKTTASINYGKQLAEEYDQLVYSGYLDPGKTAEIAGINLFSEAPSEERAETLEGGAAKTSGDDVTEPSGDDSTKPSGNDVTEPSGDDSAKPSGDDVTEPSGDDDSTESSGDDVTEPSEDDNASDEEKPESSSSAIEIDPDLKKYTVTFDTGISGVSGEKREVVTGKTVSEEVSVDGKPAEILRIGDSQIKRNEGGQEVTYIFGGWYKDNECTERWDFAEDVIRRDTTIYAKWDRKAAEKTNTVTFNMNGGGFTGEYKGTSYTDAASLTAKITTGKAISSAEYPGNGSSTAFRYSNYTTDANWYKDKECLESYNSDTVLNSDITLYKKWYYTSSGFTMNPSGNVLYRYSGSVENVTIPNSVTVIGSDAFASVGGVSGIVLPDNISEVKENAFSGVNKVSKDITITGKTEKAQNVAKELAKQYTRLVYEDSDISQDDGSDSSVVVSRTASGSIKLGATISGSIGTTGDNASAAVPDSTSTTGTIALGASSMGASASTRTTVVSPQTAGSQSAAASQNAVTSDAASSSPSASTAQNIASASAPKSTQHIKDSTPKTGDPLQYRMLIVCAMFSVGVLLVLTGNGKKKRFSAS